MTPDKQRIAIAEACGWKKSGLWAWDGQTCYEHAKHDPRPASQLPDYLGDLNAMHEAEKVLDATNGGPKSGDCLRYAYSRTLYKLVPEWVQPFRATAAQRAEAFLRTIGRWEGAAP